MQTKIPLLNLEWNFSQILAFEGGIAKSHWWSCFNFVFLPVVPIRSEPILWFQETPNAG